MTEGRFLKRRHLIYYLEVYDQESGELLGHLVDITTRGIKLVGKQPLTGKELYRMRMMLPTEYFSEGELRFTARPLWSSNDINPDFFDTGFEAVDLDERAGAIITSLIEELGFRDY